MGHGVSQRQLDQMAGEIHRALFGPGGVADLLPADERQMLEDTDIDVEDFPSRHDIGLLQEDSDNGKRLLGLFTNPPAVVRVYAANVIRAGYDPVDVAIHEVGHRLNYDHSLRDAAVALQAPKAAAHTAPAEARVLVAPDSCPFCLLHARTAEVMALVDGLRIRAQLQHQIPLGLGGTIPLAARKVAEARGALATAATYLPDRAGAVREADGYLAQLQQRLQQWLAPDDLAGVYVIARKAWDRAYDLNWVYWLRTVYGVDTSAEAAAAMAASWAPVGSAGHCPSCGGPSSV